MIDNPLYRHPSIKVLRRAVARESRLQLIAAVVLIISGLAATYYAWEQSKIVVGLGSVAVLTGIGLAVKFARRQRVENTPLIQVLFQQPEKVVWVYGLVTQHQPFGFNTTRSGVLYFHLLDGDTISVSLPADRLKQVSFVLNRMLPRAVFGYTEERAQQFKRDPQLLLR